MKEMIAVVGVALCMASSGVDINLSGVLPLDEAIDRAERGDAHGLYSLAINCAKGAEAAEWGTSHWLRESVWKLLNQAAAAGSADAWLLMGALAERELYDKYIFVWMYSSGGRQGGGAVSSLPALETDVLTDDILRSITPELPGTDSASKSVTMARRRLGNAGRRLGMVRNQADQKRFLVYHSDSQESVWYNPNGLTNEVVKTYIRSQYLKAKELGSPSAAAALSHFETNCLRMAAIMDAIATEIRQREVERAEQRAQFRVTREEQMRIREAREVATKREYVEGCAINKSACVVNKPAGAAQKPVSEKSSVAEKLGQCDFLLNKDFKKNAKVYLCLFSASWCPPCRAEMPRIAKTYAETLKDDPDIELIHFSRDQNDEKAMAWAKEHDVKFPVVKPNGGNPLNLHASGIPHLFIVKADGTLVEEGHPMRIFNEEKFREIKSGNMKPRTAYANLKSGVERTEQVDGYIWTYQVENGEATIVAAGGKRRCTISPSPKGDLTIPSKLGGMNVTKIGSEAFCGCSGITSVTFPASVKEICWRAFSECGSLTTVWIPSEVTKIYPAAFSGCWSLTAITVSDENTQYASRDGILFDKGMKTLVCYPGGIPGAYVIPSGVTEIGGNAFSGCSGLTSVTVSDDVTQIGEWAFSSCRGLNSVKVGRGVTRIAQGPFYMCSGLTSVSVDAGNERYSSRDGVLFDKGMKTLICCPSGISGEYVIPSSVTSIGIYAFHSCRKLTSVTIPDGVTSIAQSVFCYSDQLTVVSVPGSVERIGDWAFSGCRGLDTVKISNGVTSIGTGMFCGCFKLTSMTMPSSVKSIKKYAFSSCRELMSLTMQGERPEVEADAFKSCDKLKAIHVPANAKSWAGMKEWQGIPLVFDAEAKK